MDQPHSSLLASSRHTRLRSSRSTDRGQKVALIDRTNTSESRESDVVGHRIDPPAGEDLVEVSAVAARASTSTSGNRPGNSDGAVRARPTGSWPLTARRLETAWPIPFDAPVTRMRRFTILFTFTVSIVL